MFHYLDIKKTSGKIREPFFSAPLIDLSVQWHALIFEHAAVGNIVIQRAKMNLVMRAIAGNFRKLAVDIVVHPDREVNMKDNEDRHEDDDQPKPPALCQRRHFPLNA